MVTVTFKAQEDLKKMLDGMAKYKGVSLSSLIKLILTQGLKEELSKKTVNGFTVRKELEILEASDEPGIGPFSDVESLFKSLDEED
ncbi:hypothetical protein HOE67_04715 [Candidatus Peregrinibacteria bacterium]|jgi:hypothetical protein|nr:hypothetical protein [Candidatus Peregrinibacteria bacterium]MBT4056384.1 hypothetical protein [Candidatus Peregrinibacteria bacterium]